MNCPKCEIKYNLKNRKPILLPCGDSFCFKCIYKLKKQPEFLCPIDNKTFDKFFSYPINEDIFKNIETPLQTSRKNSFDKETQKIEISKVELKQEKNEIEQKPEIPKTENKEENSKISNEKAIKIENPEKIEKTNQIQKSQKTISRENSQESFLDKQEELKELTMQIIDKEISKITDNYDFNFKLITIGNTFTGKTSLLSRYFKNIFDKTSPTITVDFFTKTLKIDERSVLFTAYDTAGSESYMSITSKYVRNKHCILFVFDLSKKESFLDVKKWIDFADNLKRNDALCVLVGNKSDMQKEVSSREALDFAKKMKMAYFEVSSMNGENVKKLFKYCAVRSYRRFFRERKVKDVEEFRVFNKKIVKKGCFEWLLRLFR